MLPSISRRKMRRPFSYMAQAAWQRGRDLGKTVQPTFSQFTIYPGLRMGESKSLRITCCHRSSLNSPNMVLDLRAPKNHDYQQVKLDEVIAQYLAGELDTDQAAQTLTDAWNEITDEAGRDQQLATYKATIGAE
jgi:multiple sugar transport system substrate-binding protein